MADFDIATSHVVAIVMFFFSVVTSVRNRLGANNKKWWRKIIMNGAKNAKRSKFNVTLCHVAANQIETHWHDK